jgi:hypothetical protein
VKSRRPSDEKSQQPGTRWNGRSSPAPPHKMEPRIRLRPYRSTLTRIADISARTSRTHRSTSSYSRYSTHGTHGNYSYIPHKILTYLPRWLRRPLGHWLNRFEQLITEEWRERVWLIWGVWCTMSLAYTMFNVYLPTLLEVRSQRASRGGGVESRWSRGRRGNYVDALWEIVLYALGGCPGALVCL